LEGGHTVDVDVTVVEITSVVVVNFGTTLVLVVVVGITSVVVVNFGTTLVLVDVVGTTSVLVVRITSVAAGSWVSTASLYNIQIRERTRCKDNIGGCRI
jgi:hypothetical protein